MPTPEELVQEIINDPRARTLLEDLISNTMAPKEVAPSEAIPLDFLKDAWTEFKEQLDPQNVPWSEVNEDLIEEMVDYIRNVCRFRERDDRKSQSPPTDKVIRVRVKRYYRAKRQQSMTAASPEKRRRRRFQNRRNRLTMVRCR
ncbi:hypothetical protein ACROYT_G031096 [Oculina patagonica]